MKISKVLTAAVVIFVAIAAAAATGVWAQGATTGQGSDGSLAGVTAELRQLRMAVQDSSQRQAQLQAMNVYVAAQQSRLAQVSARLDTAHATVVAAAAQSRQASRQLADGQAELATASTVSERTHAEGMVKMFKQQADQAAADENEARTRETEFIAMFRAEEARWLELMARLEELVKR